MKLIFASLVSLVTPMCAHAAGCPALPSEIERSISRHIDALRASEDCDARSIKAEDGITAVIYTAEGACIDIDRAAKPGTCSNNWTRYMVALHGKRLTTPIEIGGKGIFSDSRIDIRDGIIVVSGFSESPGDAMCCPSRAETRKFKVRGSRLLGVR